MNKYTVYAALAVVLILTALLFYGKFRAYKSRQYRQLYPLELTSPVSSELDNAVWLIGDSRARMWDAGSMPLPDSVRILNLGIGGQTSAQVAGRFRLYLEHGRPKLVILQAGINDLKNIGLFPDADIPGKCLNELSAIIRMCRTKNIPVIVTAIFPVGSIELARRLVWDSSTGQEIINTNRQLQSHCTDEFTVFFDAYRLLADSNGRLNPAYEEDFLHINAAGYQLLNEEIQPEIHRILAIQAQ